MIEKGLVSAADLAFLDLEDSVAPSGKSRAREMVIEAICAGDWHGKPRAIRINALDTPYCYRDIVDVVEGAGENLDVIIVPKVEQPADLSFVITMLSQIERGLGLRSAIGLEAQIESAKGLINCESIAGTSEHLQSIVFGPGDFAATMAMPQARIGVPDEWDERYGSHRWHYAMSKIAVAGRAADVRVIDGPYADFRDAAGFRQSCQVARALGYDGKWCIHPDQIAIANEVFSPSDDEVAWSQRVLEVYRSAEESGIGAIELDGRMIDAASIRMAERTMAIVAKTPSRQS